MLRKRHARWAPCHPPQGLPKPYQPARYPLSRYASIFSVRLPASVPHHATGPSPSIAGHRCWKTSATGTLVDQPLERPHDRCELNPMTPTSLRLSGVK